MAVFKNAVGIPDQDAINFINATGITSPTQMAAINRLVLDLKGFVNPNYSTVNIWNKMKAIYPFVGQSGVSGSFQFNLKNTNTFKSTFNSGWTFASTGVKANGSQYMSTGLFPNVDLTNKNVHVSVYSRTDGYIAGYDYGSNNNNSEVIDGYLNYAADFGCRLNTNSALGNRPVFYPTTSLGLFIGSTQASNSRKIYQNGILKAENTANDTSTLPTVEMVLGAVNKDSVIGFYGQREYSFFSIGDGLTDTEAANLYTAVQRFQTTLGRQV